ncbi:alpha/beta hydrolase [Flavobacterium sp. RSB2_4_14]|uniref:alpha/beta hydrolase n=1 Tax=Flavobacterium sp. RSB2_4_14 TaxID=3447665 RepID=UPI003F312000
MAYQLFSQPRKGKLKKDKLPKTLQSATLETFQYQEDNIQTYIWKGDENIILLIHGWESNSSRWKKLLHHIKPLGKTIIAIDGPAHGLSDGKEFNAPKYAEFIHTVTQKYQPEIVIGHSIGGAAIAFYLHKYKNPLIKKVILLGSPSDFKILSNNFVSLLSLNSKIKTVLENYYHEKFDIHIDHFSGHVFAESFPQKAFIAHDKEDKVVLVHEGRKYASTWKNAVYVETTGNGHSLHNNELYQKVISFIKEA